MVAFVNLEVINYRGFDRFDRSVLLLEEFFQPFLTMIDGCVVNESASVSKRAGRTTTLFPYVGVEYGC